MYQQKEIITTKILKIMDELIGQTIVGYRYGEAPENGKSWNTSERKFECGVSMAKVGYDKEIAWSADTSAKKYYYIGVIAGEGGDDEICLKDVKRITYKEYLKLLKEYKEISNNVVNCRYDRLIRLFNRGFNVAKSVEEIENKRKKYLRK